MKKIFYLIACAALAFSCATKSADISGKWNIDSACGLSTENGERQAYLIFKDGRVNGNASVNSFFGDYRYQDGKLSFSAMGMTRMMGASMEIEDSVMSAIDKIATLEINGENAVAYDEAGNVVMTLTKAAEEACTEECGEGSCADCEGQCAEGQCCEEADQKAE